MRSRSRERQKSSKPSTPEIPDKLYFRIGEVARLCGVPAYVLRFWEGEFPQLKPGKSGTGQRLYRRHEVEAALRIKTLLYSEGYTIPGARQALQEESRKKADTRTGELPLNRAGLEAQPRVPRLARLRTELREILGLLSTPPGDQNHGDHNPAEQQGRTPRATQRPGVSQGSGVSQGDDMSGPNLFDGHES
jgi:DNA-binding transcriptional MerR regulator